MWKTRKAQITFQSDFEPSRNKLPSNILGNHYLVYCLKENNMSSDIIHIPVYYSGRHGEGYVYKKSSNSVHRKLKIKLYNQDGSRSDHHCIYDPDIDVLKLLCITKAKELGWNIENFNNTMR